MLTAAGRALSSLVLTVAGAAAAAPSGAPRTAAAPGPDQAPCVAPAAAFHGVNPWVLRAILKVESGFNPTAVNRNANGTVDIGMAQINSIHLRELARWGVGPENLMDGCVATYVAAWHLAKQIRRHGDTWFGVASYHSTTPCQNARYAALLWNTLLGWGVVQGQRMRVVSLQSCGYVAPGGTASVRSPAARNGRASGLHGRASPILAFDEGGE